VTRGPSPSDHTHITNTSGKPLFGRSDTMIRQGNQAKVFLSCGLKDDKERERAKKIEAKVLAKFECFLAWRHTSLEPLPRRIIQELESSEYILFIDSKREQLVDLSPKRPGGDAVYRGPLFCHQEVALAAYLGLEYACVREKGVEQHAGMLGQMLDNAKEFRTEEELMKAVDKILDHWTNSWKNQLTIDCEEGTPKLVLLGQQAIPSAFFRLQVHNHHRMRPALGCRAFVERVYDVKGKKVMLHKFVELKWSGYIFPDTVIVPARSRLLDGLRIMQDRPGWAQFVTFTDSGEFSVELDHGAYDITYLVFSDNFLPARSTVRVTLKEGFNLGYDGKLSGVSFVKVEHPEE
jgi:hypothetical protein